MLATVSIQSLPLSLSVAAASVTVRHACCTSGKANCSGCCQNEVVPRLARVSVITRSPSTALIEVAERLGPYLMPGFEQSARLVAETPGRVALRRAVRGVAVPGVGDPPVRSLAVLSTGPLVYRLAG